MDDNTVENAIEPEKPRSLDAILALDYSQLTSDELEMVIEYKAEIKARNDQFERNNALIKEKMNEIIEDNRKQYDEMRENHQKLVDYALERLERADNG